MDPQALAELADSIRVQGVMQPILVRPVDAGSTKSSRANGASAPPRLPGSSEVPVLVKPVDDTAALAMALIENIQREDLNPLEEAQGVQRLIREFDFTHEQAAHAIGRSRSATSNLLRLLNLAAPVQELLLGGQIDMGHARALLAVDAATQIQLAHRIVARGLSVRETETLVDASPAARWRAAGRRAVRAAATSSASRKSLPDALGATVRLAMKAKGGGRLIDRVFTTSINSTVSPSRIRGG